MAERTAQEARLSTSTLPAGAAALDPLDFERRDWVYDGEWPFSYDDVAAYYPRAAAYCAMKKNAA